MNKSQQSVATEEIIISQTVSAWLTWPVIIVTFFIFWPASMFLIWKRINVAAKTAVGGSKALKYLGWLSIIASIVLVLTTPQGTRYLNGVQTYFFITFFAGGIGLIILETKIFKFSYRFQIYMNLILGNGVTSIDEIAVNMQKSYWIVAGDLQKLINMGIFAGAHIDEALREIILPGNQKYDQKSASYDQERQEIVITCKGCGAVNKVVEGRAATCEFCGSPISGG